MGRERERERWAGQGRGRGRGGSVVQMCTIKEMCVAVVTCVGAKHGLRNPVVKSFNANLAESQDPGQDKRNAAIYPHLHTLRSH